MAMADPLLHEGAQVCPCGRVQEGKALVFDYSSMVFTAVLLRLLQLLLMFLLQLALMAENLKM